MPRGTFKNPEKRNRLISEHNARYYHYHKQTKEHRLNIEKSKKGLFQKNKYYCVDCNKILFRRAKTQRCMSCSKKWQIKNGAKIGFQKGCHVNKGVKKSQATRIKMSLWQKGREKEWLKQEKHWNWQGGLSNIGYPIEFDKTRKKFVRQGFNFKCQLCGIAEYELGYALSLHHIDYNKKNNSTDNWIPLCKKCHQHTNFNREFWTGSLQELIKISTSI